LKKGIYFRAYAHKDPKIEYQKESFVLFDGMMKRIRETTIEYVFRVQVNVMPKSMLSADAKATKPDVNGEDNDKPSKTNSFSTSNHRDLKKIGRNDPCPCGSGKKYKKCCGKNI
jgi:preprotein translocase subunit SecA